MDIEFDFESSPPIKVVQAKNSRLSVPVSWIVITILGCFLVWQLVSAPDSPKRDNQTIVDEKDDIFGSGYLVFVREGMGEKGLTASQEDLLSSADKFVESKGMAGKRDWDEDQPAAEELVKTARAKGIKGPFVAIIADRSIKRIVPWPKDYAALEESLK